MELEADQNNIDKKPNWHKYFGIIYFIISIIISVYFLSKIGIFFLMSPIIGIAGIIVIWILFTNISLLFNKNKLNFTLLEKLLIFIPFFLIILSCIPFIIKEFNFQMDKNENFNKTLIDITISQNNQIKNIIETEDNNSPEKYIAKCFSSYVYYLNKDIDDCTLISIDVYNYELNENYMDSKINFLNEISNVNYQRNPYFLTQNTNNNITIIFHDTIKNMMKCTFNVNQSNTENSISKLKISKKYDLNNKQFVNCNFYTRIK